MKAATSRFFLTNYPYSCGGSNNSADLLNTTKKAKKEKKTVQKIQHTGCKRERMLSIDYNQCCLIISEWKKRKTL